MNMNDKKGERKERKAVRNEEQEEDGVHMWQREWFPLLELEEKETCRQRKTP